MPDAQIPNVRPKVPVATVSSLPFTAKVVVMRPLDAVEVTVDEPSAAGAGVTMVSEVGSMLAAPPCTRVSTSKVLAAGALDPTVYAAIPLVTTGPEPAAPADDVASTTPVALMATAATAAIANLTTARTRVQRSPTMVT